MAAKLFSDFKKQKDVLTEKLIASVNEATNKQTFEKDERYWTFPVDKAGNGRVILRFLPSQFDDEAFVKFIDHSYKGPGGWYIEKSLTTFKQPDPMAEYNNLLWQVRRTKPESEVNAAEKIYNGSSQKEPGTRPSTRYVANILIENDGKKVDSNNGKVFLFKFGPEIFTKIDDAIKPKLPGVEKFQPFDLWEGRSLDLRALSVKGKRSYSSSVWLPSGPVAKTEKEIEEIFKMTYSVKDEISPDKFKTYDQLKKRLDLVRGEGLASSSREELPRTEEPSFKSSISPPWEEDTAAQEVVDENDKVFMEFQELLNK